MTQATIDTINAMFSIVMIMWSLLGLVLWYFKRDSFFWFYPSSDFILGVPVIAFISVLALGSDQLPGAKIGIFINVVMIIGFIVVNILPLVYNGLVNFRKNIVGNKIK